MKNLSIEQKAEAYDKAIEGIQEILSSGEDSIKMSRLQLRLQGILPELKESKESKDERIRKALIEGLKAMKNNFHTISSIKIDDAIDWLEKLAEQKPAVKVEPKFKIEKGKWYVCIKDLLDNYANKAFYKGDTYLSTQDGSLIPSNSNVPFEVVCTDTYFRDWILQDARDGDILVDKSGGREYPFIFKETKPSNIKTDMLHPLTILGYCGIGGAGFTKSSGWGDTVNCTYYPANKEQSDILFTKMKEEGYEWDADKKEIKKIKSKPADIIQQDFEKYVEHLLSLSDGEGHGSPAKLKEVCSELLRLAKLQQNPAWSEEDKDFMYDTLSNLTELKDRYGEEYGNVGKCIDWIKSIKDRVHTQPKQDWSEDDEEIVKNILSVLDVQVCWDGATGKKGNPYQKEIDWLKSIKERYTWKPINDQIVALEHFVRSIWESEFASPYDNNIKLVYSLLKQLKELKE